VHPGRPLRNVRVKWNWKWADCTWDRATDTVTCYFGTRLAPGLYTAQIHGWDADSNHYVYAWLFQQGRVTRARSHDNSTVAAAAPAPRDTTIPEKPQLVLLTPTGVRNE
jgi:hypothetical protein